MRDTIQPATTERWNPAFRLRQGCGGQAERGWLRLFVSLPARAVSGLIWIYQRTVSPALVVISPTCGCRFAPTCSHYARESLREHGLLVGAALTARRLAKCGPWHPGGLDPVPPRKCFRIRPNLIS